jgi:hypothetical protein
MKSSLAKEGFSISDILWMDFKEARYHQSQIAGPSGN